MKYLFNEFVMKYLFNEFAKSKLTNLKTSGGFFQKSIYIQTHSVWSFSDIVHTQERRQGVPCMSSNRLSRSGLPSLIYSRSTLQSLVKKIYKLGDFAYFSEFYKSGEKFLLNLENAG